jgi:hypothetical protein
LKVITKSKKEKARLGKPDLCLGSATSRQFGRKQERTIAFSCFPSFRDTNFCHHVLKWQQENSQKANIFLVEDSNAIPSMGAEKLK